MIKKYKLLNGVEIPNIGFGTWLIEGDNARILTEHALSVGYFHIDTAADYFNEKEVGLAIKNANLKREDIFLTTKVSGNIKDYYTAKLAILDSLKKLDIGYIDLILIHSPKPWAKFTTNENFDKENLEVYKALEEAYDAGLVKTIGVSNFSIADMKNLINNAKVKPMVNQVLAHIKNTPFELIDFCKKNGIIVEAYSPFGHGEILNDKDILKIAEKYQTTAAKICLAYCLQLGLIPLPKSNNKLRIKENLKIDFKISDEDMEFLKKLSKIDSYGENSKFPVFNNL